MIWTNNNYSILPFYDSLSQQHWRKSYVYEQVWPLVSLIQRVPPFQIIRTTDLTDPITSVTITYIPTMSVTDITTHLTNTGLEILNFTAYDIIRYPGLQNMTDITFQEGHYYLTMTDGTNTWYSEVFCMRVDLSGMIKLRYWHDTGFAVQNGHISYADPFYNFVYLGYNGRPINKPKYQYEEEVDERDGYKFLIHQVRKKIFRFVVLVPEFMADALTIAPLHNFRVIESEGLTYNCDELTITPLEWVEQGHVVPLEIEFATDTVVQVTGKVKPETEGFAYNQAAYSEGYN